MIPPSQHNFQQLVPLMLQAVQQLIQAGDEENVIQAFEVFDELLAQVRCRTRVRRRPSRRRTPSRDVGHAEVMPRTGRSTGGPCAGQEPRADARAVCDGRAEHGAGGGHPRPRTHVCLLGGRAVRFRRDAVTRPVRSVVVLTHAQLRTQKPPTPAGVAAAWRAENLLSSASCARSTRSLVPSCSCSWRRHTTRPTGPSTSWARYQTEPHAHSGQAFRSHALSPPRALQEHSHLMPRMCGHVSAPLPAF